MDEEGFSALKNIPKPINIFVDDKSDKITHHVECLQLLKRQRL